jgi:hypothetical protein
MGGKLVKSGLLETGKMPVRQEGGEGCDRALPPLLRINTQKIPVYQKSKILSQDA